MKKFITTFMMVAMIAVMVPLMSTSADAQTRRHYRNGRAYTTTTNRRPSFYRRHRNLINIGVGAGAGALLGGLFGGKKGALIGGAAGGGGAALYTYKLKPKSRRYYRSYRRY